MFAWWAQLEAAGSGRVGAGLLLQKPATDPGRARTWCREVPRRSRGFGAPFSPPHGTRGTCHICRAARQTMSRTSSPAGSVSGHSTACSRTEPKISTLRLQARDATPPKMSAPCPARPIRPACGRGPARGIAVQLRRDRRRRRPETEESGGPTLLAPLAEGQAPSCVHMSAGDLVTQRWARSGQQVWHLPLGQPA